jgi:CheY-like chemotaxis protein
VDYRLSTQAVFPAQIHDIKAAIRFLRARAAEFRLNTEKIAIVGSSAGGHLAALVGVTNGHKMLEGRIGDHLDQSSRVDAIVTDMMMPGMDGTALVAEVRRRLARPDLPALITSGYAAVSLHDSIAAAATSFLPKPYALRELSDRVAALVPAPEGVAPT